MSYLEMSEMMGDDFEWQPPSEAEMKIIQARRERDDKISKRMGDYLLKGYKMLGITCPECATILLQDKHGENYCIACRELDTDTNKDDPVTNTEAARSQILEGSVTDHVDDDDLSYMPRREPTAQQLTSASPGTSTATAAMATVTPSGVSSQSLTSNEHLNFVESVDTLCQKIKWATDELKKSSSIDYCVNLCLLIKSSADAIQSLKQIS